MPGPRKYQKLLSLPNEHTEGITSVAFSPCGAYIVTAGLDGKLCWWRTDDGRLLYVWTGNSAVLSLAWIPGREDCIICGLQDGNVAMLKVTSVSLHCCPFLLAVSLLLGHIVHLWILGAQVSCGVHRNRWGPGGHRSPQRAEDMGLDHR